MLLVESAKLQLVVAVRHAVKLMKRRSLALRREEGYFRSRRPKTFARERFYK